MSAPHGPYQTEEEARTGPAVRAVYEAMRATSRRDMMQDASEALITGACAAAGVELGAYDARVVRWVAGFEPQACAVIAGLIARAAGAGGTGLPPELAAPDGVLPWIMADDKSHWRAQLPDGRTAVIRRKLGEDGESSLLFVPAVYESAGDFVTGPECGSVLAAAQWAAEHGTVTR